MDKLKQSATSGMLWRRLFHDNGEICVPLKTRKTWKQMDGHIKPEKKYCWVFELFNACAARLCKYKGNPKKYKGKYGLGPYSLSFFQFKPNLETRLLHFLYCICRDQYWLHLWLNGYGHISHMVMWPYSRMIYMAIFIWSLK